MIEQRDVRTDDGRVLRAYDSGAADGDRVLVWHPGSPHTGAPLEPVLAMAAERGIRLLSYARPGYGGSTRSPDRTVASAASDAAAVADGFGVERYAVVGYSGGGPHALACAALTPERVGAVVCLAGIAPYTDEFDWFAGMMAPGALLAAREGRAARERFAETDEFDPEIFTAADHDALSGPWKALGADAGAAGEAGSDGLVDDDVAFMTPWGFDLSAITAPVLFVRGGQDRVVPPSHGDWQHERVPGSELWRRPGDGHVSVLNSCAEAMDWLPFD